MATQAVRYMTISGPSMSHLWDTHYHGKRLRDARAELDKLPRGRVVRLVFDSPWQPASKVEIITEKAA